MLSLAHAGRHIVSGGQDGHVCVWDSATQERVGRYPVAGAISMVTGVDASGSAVAATTLSNTVECVHSFSSTAWAFLSGQRVASH